MQNSVPRCLSASFSVDRSVGVLWTEFACITPAAHSYEDVRNPKYFGGQRTRNPKSPRPTDTGLRVGDIIRIRAENGLWMAEFVVRDIPDGLDEVHTDELRFISFAADKVPEGYSLTWRGIRGWVISLNGDIIEEGFRTEQSAGERIKWYERNRTTQEKVARAAAKPKAKKADAEAPAE